MQRFAGLNSIEGWNLTFQLSWFKNLLKKWKKWLTRWRCIAIINFALLVHTIEQSYRFYSRIQCTEKYSRGWRGAPAKGVGRVTGARVQIPLSPFNLNQKSGTTEVWRLLLILKKVKNHVKRKLKNFKKVLDFLKNTW